MTTENEARDFHGRWTAGGADVPSPQSLDANNHEAVKVAVADAAKKLDFDPRKVTVVTDEHEFELNGQTLHAAGLAMRDTGNITIHNTPAHPLSPSSIPSLMAHEVMHQKLNAFLADYRAEREQVLALPKMSITVNTGGETPRTVMRDAMKPDGTLREPYDKQFPAYSAYVTLIEQKQGQLIKEDGCTPYSENWWKEFNGPGKQTWEEPGGMKVTIPAGEIKVTLPEGSKLLGTFGIGLEIPIHETLAEMARLGIEKQAMTERVQAQSKIYLQKKAQEMGHQWDAADEKKFQKAVKAEVAKTLGPLTVKANGFKSPKVSKDWAALYKAVNNHWTGLVKANKGNPDWYVNRYAPKAAT